MRLGEWVLRAAERLEAAGVESSRIEAQMLAAYALGHDRSWVLAHGPDPVDPEELEPLLARRMAREPLAFILGVREFFGREFRVRPGVLIPRQETETLIETALDWLDGRPQARTVLDVGAGSGCLAITLKLERPALSVAAVDVSEDALAVARENAARLGAEVEFALSDLFGALGGRRFDLIVSNPPYIAEGSQLAPEVGIHEPKEALYAGPEGLDLYRRLAAEGPAALGPEGALIVEFGDNQAADGVRVFEQAGWHLVLLARDLSGMPRAGLFGR